MNVGIVIPTLNEEKNLEKLLPYLNAAFPKSQIVVVDDLSTDSTVEIARKNRAIVPPVTKRLGLAKSYAYGLSVLKDNCDYIIQMDADHPPEHAFVMLTLLQYHDADLIIGYEGGEYRTLASNVASWIARNYLGLKFSQPTCGYMAMTSNFLNIVKPDQVRSSGDAFHLEMLYLGIKRGAKVRESFFIGKPHSSASYKRSLRWLWEVLKMRWRK